MNALYTHRIWLGLLLCAIALIAGSGPLSHLAREEAARDLATVGNLGVKAAQDLQQLRTDLAAARTLGAQIDRARADRLLAPVDRLKTAATIEEAGKAKFARFTYTLAPEERVTFNTGGETQELATSDISLAADAPDDALVCAYIAQIQHLLPGRARVKQLTITRGNPDAPLALDNVHFEAELEWLSNGALQTLAGGP